MIEQSICKVTDTKDAIGTATSFGSIFTGSHCALPLRYCDAIIIDYLSFMLKKIEWLSLSIQEASDGKRMLTTSLFVVIFVFVIGRNWLRRGWFTVRREIDGHGRGPDLGDGLDAVIWNSGRL